MKRKQAIAFNERGGAIDWIGAAARNMIQNGGYMPGFSATIGVDILGGKDYSYRTYKGYARKTFREKFDLMDFDFVRKYELWDDVRFLGFLQEKKSIPRPVFSFFGWRIVVEFFDENAIIDFTTCLDEKTALDVAKQRFLAIYSTNFDVKIINENLINVKCYETVTK